jgi:hypothetical protein
VRKDGYDWIHGCLDAEDVRGGSVHSPEEAKELDTYRRALDLLERSAEGAPEGFKTRVLASLPDQPDSHWLRRIRDLWHPAWRWALPAATGALAAALLAVGAIHSLDFSRGDLVPVTFEFHAPGAQRVEVVGSFTEWQPEGIPLEGPDGSGHWSATVRLPAGLHEYLFLVDRTAWETDPKAATHRPDGFGLENALLQI